MGVACIPRCPCNTSMPNISSWWGKLHPTTGQQTAPSRAKPVGAVRAKSVTARTMAIAHNTMISRVGWVSEERATGTVHTAKEGWGEDSKQLKNWNFGSSIISLTPSPPSPAAGFALEGRGIFGVTIQICVDNRDFEQVLRQDVPQKILAIHRKPHTVLPRAIQPRTASAAPCLKLSVDGYRQPA